MSNIESFFSDYLRGVAERREQGIPPLPLDKEQTLALCEALQTEKLDPGAFVKAGLKDTVETLIYMLEERVPPGVTDALFM